jgi:hypothetical protein
MHPLSGSVLAEDLHLGYGNYQHIRLGSVRLLTRYPVAGELRPSILFMTHLTIYLDAAPLL